MDSHSAHQPQDGEPALAAAPHLGKVWTRHAGMDHHAARPADEIPAAAWRAGVFARIVLAGMALALVFAFVMGHYFNKGYPYNTFLVGVFDCCMDFFNVNYYSYGLNPYPTLIPYPPFAMLLARVFACGFDYAAHGAHAAQASLAGKASCLLLLGGFCAFFVAAVYRTARTGSRGGDLKLALALCASYPVLFLLDRGNYVTVAFACLFGFVHYYPSRPKLACLCLALAGSLKIYPLLFLLLPAADRRWRDCARILLLTAALNLGALLFFENDVFTNTRLFFRNLLVFNKGFPSVVIDAGYNLSLANLLRVPSALFFHNNPQRLLRLYPLVMLAVVGVLYWALRREQTYWKRVLLLTVAQVQLPGYTADYNLIYLVIPLLLYFRQAGERTRQDYFYLACLGLLFIPKHYYVLGVDGLSVLSVQAFVNPLLLLGLFLFILRPRLARYALAGGSLVLLAGLGYTVFEQLTPRAPAAPGPEPSPPFVSVKGIDGNWVLRDGLAVVGPSDILRLRPTVVLRGPAPKLEWLGGRLPGVEATLVLSHRSPKTVPASLTASGGEYVLSVNLDPAGLPEQGPAEVRLRFDSSFVPQDLGLWKNDKRKLVMQTPYTLALQTADGGGSAAGVGMKGMAGTWLVREGFAVTGPADVLRQRPVVRLRGQAFSVPLLGGRLPGVQATLSVAGRPDVPARAELRPDGEDYVLTLALDPADLPGGGPAEVRLTFDRWFVPKALGMGEDNRELVLPTPHSLALLPAGAAPPPPTEEDEWEEAQAEGDQRPGRGAEPDRK